MTFVLHIQLELVADEDELAEVMEALDDGEVEVVGYTLTVTGPVGLERRIDR